jgi:hypothetical protein
MRYKQLVTKQLDEVKNLIIGQESMISQLRPPAELKAQLERIQNKLQEIQVLVNTENETM